MGWLGRRLANREHAMYERLADLGPIAKSYQDISCQGRKLPNACAHDFIDGHPLRWHDLVDDQFFDKLESLLKGMHQKNVAYVDMNKSENIIVNTDGNPCLIDFQISVHWANLLLRIPLRILQRSDLYHCNKLKRRFRPDLLSDLELKAAQPWWIKMHRMIANPFRAARRRLLVALGIRKGNGKPQSESFIEEALQGDQPSSTELAAKPILQLYRVLRSSGYLDKYGQSAKSYTQRLMLDLLQGQTLHSTDLKLAERIEPLSDHDKVVEILKSRSFFTLSRRWNNNWIRNRIQAIRTAMLPRELISRRAA